MAKLSELEFAAERAPIVFDVQRADLSVNINFGKPFWPLFHNIPQFYSALLTRLGEFGLSSNSIRSDVADGTLGAYNVNFWMLDFRALVRIRLERLEFQFNMISSVDRDRVERALVRIAEALAASSEDFEVASYGVDLGLHGHPTGIEPREYLSRFIRNVPEGLGPHSGSAVVFYFGEKAPEKTITADLSVLVPGALYVRLNSIFTGIAAPVLPRLFDAYEMTALRSIGLERRTT